MSTRFIARNSKRHAREWLAGAWEKIFSLADSPQRFAVISEAEELGAELRDLLHFSHRIIYRVRETDQTVEILRVYHAARRPLSGDDFD